MNNCLIFSEELWSGFLGTVIGAMIGGYIAYRIAKIQIRKQEKEFQIRDKKEKENTEIQLLWNIYFDIKKDCENSKLWDKYDEILQKRDNIRGTPTAEYIDETIVYIMRDIRNLLKLLKGKENENLSLRYNELDLLWERTAQLLVFMFKIYDKLLKFDKRENKNTVKYYEEANNLFQSHNKILQKNSV